MQSWSDVPELEQYTVSVSNTTKQGWVDVDFIAPASDKTNHFRVPVVVAKKLGNALLEVSTQVPRDAITWQEREAKRDDEE